MAIKITPFLMACLVGTAIVPRALATPAPYDPIYAELSQLCHELQQDNNGVARDLGWGLRLTANGELCFIDDDDTDVNTLVKRNAFQIDHDTGMAVETEHRFEQPSFGRQVRIDTNGQVKVYHDESMDIDPLVKRNAFQIDHDTGMAIEAERPFGESGRLVRIATDGQVKVYHDEHMDIDPLVKRSPVHIDRNTGLPVETELWSAEPSRGRPVRISTDGKVQVIHDEHMYIDPLVKRSSVQHDIVETEHNSEESSFDQLHARVSTDGKIYFHNDKPMESDSLVKREPCESCGSCTRKSAKAKQLSTSTITSSATSSASASATALAVETSASKNDAAVESAGNAVKVATVAFALFNVFMAFMY